MASLPDTLNARWKEDKSRFGYKMLQKMGWSEDKGLGKNETGAVAAVKLKKREDGAGLGVEKMTDGAGAKGWSETATSFNSVLDTLKGVYGKDKKKRKKESEGESGSPLRISAGMKYKKHAQAKSLSNKSQEELRAVLGAAYNPASASASASAEGTGEKKKRKSKEKSEKREKRERETKRRRSGTNSTSTDDEEPPHVTGKEKEKEASSSHRRSGSISTVGSASIKVSLARRRSNSTSSMGSLGSVASHDDSAAPKKAKAKVKLEEQQAETKSQKKDKLKKKDRGDK